MTSRQKKTPGAGAALIWERPEPAVRPAPGPLSRDRIVRAAIALADAEGLAAVSLRKVGASLDAGPMRLYGYLDTKEELLELMVDVVYGEMASAGPIPGDWREALRTLAHRTRRAAREHGWFIDLLGGRPHLGPNALAYLEASLAALSGAPGFEDIDAVMLAVGAVNAYVIGALRGEANELHAELASGMNQTEWQRASDAYIHRMIATGRFPTLARVVQDATHPPADVLFDRGLDCVLDGIEARLSRGTRAGAGERKLPAT
ncbi:TetR family transcriptional regulator [Sorangium cellulosum]|uniref:TetR family transcriptional regulator n=1 Tax=Sorangium cellulosum TaxID=56 RepID=A0A2L0EKS7_SORCE|nr:TetR/AcrR family transcriptional regulator C-terminal domain-containing protein [Sorangium cellulosum]AUX39906.1 TetR family transcriptional regulator [Sorangium cellulosum]